MATVVLNPGDDVPTIVTANPAGTAFIFNPGTYRITQYISPKTGNVFEGRPGAILNGSRLLTSWTVSGATWYATGQTQEGQQVGQCDPAWPLCANSEDLFIDDVPMVPVATLGEVTTGTWFFDHAADRIYIGNNPAGHVVETSIAETCITTYPTNPDNITIQGLIIEKCANRAQYGAIQAEGWEADVHNWTMLGNEVRLCHGVGIRTSHGSVVRGNYLHHMGQLGIGGSGDSVVVENNVVSYNNFAGFSQGWESGGSKFVQCRNLILRGNYFHHNILGNGIWCDIDNRYTLIEKNRSEDNAGVGIFIEISYGAIIRQNTVLRNGTWTGDPYTTPSGILISASPDVEVYGNTLAGNGMGITGVQQSRGSGAYGPYEINNLYVHDNVVTQETGIMAGGIVQDVGDPTYFTSRNNRWRNDTYVLGTGSAANFAWQDNYRTLAEWRAYGNDTVSTAVVAATPGGVVTQPPKEPGLALLRRDYSAPDSPRRSRPRGLCPECGQEMDRDAEGLFCWDCD